MDVELVITLWILKWLINFSAVKKMFLKNSLVQYQGSDMLPNFLDKNIHNHLLKYRNCSTCHCTYVYSEGMNKTGNEGTKHCQYRYLFIILHAQRSDRNNWEEFLMSQITIWYLEHKD
jgi:hypothetical protein